MHKQNQRCYGYMVLQPKHKKHIKNAKKAYVRREKYREDYREYFGK